MRHVDRRGLLKLAGAGSVLVAGAALPAVRWIAGQDSDVLGFRATLGLPEPPLPSYATYVVEGTVNLTTGTGLVTSRVLAGHPGAPSAIGLPGLGRSFGCSGSSARGPGSACAGSSTTARSSNRARALWSSSSSTERGGCLWRRSSGARSRSR